MCGSQGFPVPIRTTKGWASLPSFQSFPVISEVELWSLGVSLSLDRRTCPSVSCHPPASSTAQLCSPSSACTSVPSCYPSLLVFTTLILLDHLTQDTTAAWRMYATFLSGCFRVAQGKTEKHVVPTSVRERRNGDSLRAFSLSPASRLRKTVCVTWKRHNGLMGLFSSLLLYRRSLTKLPLKVTFQNQLNYSLTKVWFNTQYSMTSLM